MYDTKTFALVSRSEIGECIHSVQYFPDSKHILSSTGQRHFDTILDNEDSEDSCHETENEKISLNTNLKINSYDTEANVDFAASAVEMELVPSRQPYSGLQIWQTATTSGV